MVVGKKAWELAILFGSSQRATLAMEWHRWGWQAGDDVPRKMACRGGEVERDGTVDIQIIQSRDPHLADWEKAWKIFMFHCLIYLYLILSCDILGGFASRFASREKSKTHQLSRSKYPSKVGFRCGSAFMISEATASGFSAIWFSMLTVSSSSFPEWLAMMPNEVTHPKILQQMARCACGKIIPKKWVGEKLPRRGPSPVGNFRPTQPSSKWWARVALWPQWNHCLRTYCNKNFRGWIAGFNPFCQLIGIRTLGCPGILATGSYSPSTGTNIPNIDY